MGDPCPACNGEGWVSVMDPWGYEMLLRCDQCNSTGLAPDE